LERSRVLGEGQAEFGTEIIGMAMRGDTSQMDYGAAVVNAGLLTALWYEPRFERMAYLFGWDGATGTIPGAPARCSLYGFGGVASPCVDAYTSGATWSFVRYVTDRIASVYANGEAGFHQDLIGLDPTGDVMALLETATGATVADLMLDWAAALYVDGRVSATDAPLLQLTSWDLADVFASRPAEQRLVPDSTGFVPFSVAGSVAGGGTSYTLITDTNAHDALAVRVRDPADGVLSAMLQPTVWVVRIR